MTAYRQDALDILQHLNENGPHKASNIKDLLGIARARAILYDNHYGWFEPLGKGIYGVTPQGALGLDQWKNYLL